MRQVLCNLINNAVKFTDTGHVIVRITGKKHDSTFEKMMNLRVEVEDTGPGIAESKISKIFEKFEQSDNSSTRKHEGTGLGLAIAKGIIDLMGGEIGVKNTLGHGSTFWFSADVEYNDDVVADEDLNKTEFSNKRVLIIDDNEINRNILKEQVDKWGLKATLAVGADAAMARLYESLTRNEDYDLILTDYQMPVMDGEALCIKIQKEDAFKDIPIIMISSVGARNVIEKNKKAEISAWLLKPVRPQLLLSAIVTALNLDRLSKLKNASKSFTQMKPPEEASYTAQKTIPVLIAEDNIVNQMVIRSMLEGSEFELTVVDNGFDAVTKYQHSQPKIILMDVSMPVMNGLIASKSIREYESQHNLPPVPIIATTANALKNDRDECVAAGMSGFITKPISKVELLLEMRKWVYEQGNLENYFETEKKTVGYTGTTE